MHEAASKCQQKPGQRTERNSDDQRDDLPAVAVDLAQLAQRGRGVDSTDGASLFIDVIGMPPTPVSYAGAARRTYRAVVY